MVMEVCGRDAMFLIPLAQNHFVSGHKTGVHYATAFPTLCFFPQGSGSARARDSVLARIPTSRLPHAMHHVDHEQLRCR